ncbi:hypothetical protein [Rhizobium rhizogenes]|uniref:Uncharacterized protein n=1 Tax=Rhizobium rhizogenes TaxID=359 RepID=A0AA92C5D7_RHIRH|nr:hypothetical protein [Rhizobium rhizogenes]PVE56296.1 hypothetical protein DC430_00330 [Rhizobium rhizogenes]PVE64791.1 hypothetical protein DC415_13530 [Agrobacterium tumefaciens]PVE73929.1 hypothetical protein DCP16_13530 [Sphingomonas sp. TPD3009]
MDDRLKNLIEAGKQVQSKIENDRNAARSAADQVQAERSRLFKLWEQKVVRGLDAEIKKLNETLRGNGLPELKKVEQPEPRRVGPQDDKVEYSYPRGSEHTFGPPIRVFLTKKNSYVEIAAYKNVNATPGKPDKEATVDLDQLNEKELSYQIMEIVTDLRKPDQN